jgi:hypothetical protein
MGGVWGLGPIHRKNETGRLQTVCCRTEHKLINRDNVLRLSGGGRRRRVEMMEPGSDNALSYTATNVTRKPICNVYNLYFHLTALRDR